MKTSCLLCVTISGILLFCLKLTKTEFFTAISELENLLRTEEQIVYNLKTYLKAEEEKLKKVKRFSEHYATLYKAAKDVSEEFLSNPVNAYLLIKRLTTDWEETSNLIKNTDSEALINGVQGQGFVFPNREDLSGAKDALIRLQEIYLLDTFYLARGEIKGNLSPEQLTAGECFDLGMHAYNVAKFRLSFDWMKEALSRENQEIVVTARKKDILQFMAFCQHFLNNNTYAAKLMEEILESDPEDVNAKGTMGLFRSLKDKSEDENPPIETEFTDQSVLSHEFVTPTIRKNYEKLCRGESLKTLEEVSQLYCYYTNSNNNYLLLQPVKVETLNLKPKILMYHDILREKETIEVKTLARRKLERAMVNDNETGTVKAESYRISKSAWLDEWEHFIVPRINKRIEAITSLDTVHAESLQVMNYGIGGHYEPHYDHVKPGENVSFMVKGNRIATWLFYLSDVTAGGSTVFPDAGVEVKPVKGAAAFWYNVHRNGIGDEYTRHAACPVLTGSKWVANVWFHEHGNEFRRPCGLDPSE